jgi:hypothetical protein
MHRQLFRKLLISSGLAFGFGMLVVGELRAQESIGSAPSVEGLSQPSAKDRVNNELNHYQWVHRGEDGSISGTIGAPAGDSQIRQGGVDIYLVRDGKRVVTTRSAEDGTFRLVGVEPGVYSLVAETPSTLAIMSLTVLEGVSGQHLPTGIQIRSLTPATDRVVSLLRSGSVPRATHGMLVETDPIAGTRKFLNSYKVSIDSEGGLRGRVTVPGGGRSLAGTMVYLTSAGKEVARAKTDEVGNYRFDGILPGNYGFVASGPQGVAALGFVAVSADSQDGESSALIAPDGSRYVNSSVAEASIPVLNVELASSDCLGVPVEMAGEEIAGECCPLPMGGCCGVAGGYGAAGGGGGGGVGGSFGGGLLPLAALAGLTAVGITVAKESNDDSNVIISPVIVP